MAAPRAATWTIDLRKGLKAASSASAPVPARIA
jgi:hypothetical protein